MNGKGGCAERVLLVCALAVSTKCNQRSIALTWFFEHRYIKLVAAMVPINELAAAKGQFNEASLRLLTPA